MTVTPVLLGYAVLLATGGAMVLRSAAWVHRAPRLAILTWCALSVSVIGSLLLAGVTAVVGATRGGTPDPCHAPPSWACAPVTSPAGTALAVTAAFAALAVTVRLIWSLTATYAAASRERGEQLDALVLLGHDDARLGATVIDHPAPAAYCLPGRVVVTTAAVRVLGEDALSAVLAHERAHLSQRHHLLRTTAQGLARAFPRVPAFTAAREEIARLSELAADDAAARRTGRLTVAGALLALAEAGRMAPAPAPALTAGGTASAARARRLIAAERPLGRLRVLLGLTAAVLVVSAPVAALVAVGATTSPAPHPACCTVAAQPHGLS